MKRRLLIISSFCAGLAGCASPEGTGYQRLSAESKTFTPRFVFVFNSEAFTSGVAAELSYVRTQSFAARFAASYSAILKHNGLTADVVVESAPPRTGVRATLLAEVVDVVLWNSRLSRLKWRWKLFNPEGLLIAQWESVVPWEGYGTWTFGGAPNDRHVEACIQDLALLALNTLQANGHVTLSRTPAETPSGLRKAIM